MEWSGQKNFTSQKLREWKVDGEAAGLTRSADGLTFATIQGAGHMVPYDKPVQALELVNRWLAGDVL
jgi:carboxypeptidase C (cathepsin A)